MNYKTDLKDTFVRFVTFLFIYTVRVDKNKISKLFFMYIRYLNLVIRKFLLKL